MSNKNRNPLYIKNILRIISIQFKILEQVDKLLQIPAFRNKNFMRSFTCTFVIQDYTLLIKSYPVVVINRNNIQCITLCPAWVNLTVQ